MNRSRKKRKRVNENIEQKEWKDYFMRLLGRMEHRVVGGDGERSCEDGEGELSREEIREAVRGV